MLTLNSILKEIKDVPVDRLEEVYQFVHSLTLPTQISDTRRKKILSYAGCFSDMDDADYEDFVAHTQQTRSKLFEMTMSEK